MNLLLTYLKQSGCHALQYNWSYRYGKLNVALAKKHSTSLGPLYPATELEERAMLAIMETLRPSESVLQSLGMNGSYWGEVVIDSTGVLVRGTDIYKEV